MGRITKPREYKRCSISSKTGKKLCRHIGDKILVQRQLNGATMRDVAGGSGLSNAFVCQLENGQSLPSAETLWRLSLFFGVSPGYWFEEFKE